MMHDIFDSINPTDDNIRITDVVIKQKNDAQMPIQHQTKSSFQVYHDDDESDEFSLRKSPKHDIKVSFLDTTTTSSMTINNDQRTTTSSSPDQNQQKRRSLSPRKGTPLNKKSKQQHQNDNNKKLDDDLSWNHHNTISTDLFGNNDSDNEKENNVTPIHYESSYSQPVHSQDSSFDIDVIDDDGSTIESDDENEVNVAHALTIKEWDQLVTNNRKDSLRLQQSYWQYCYGTTNDNTQPKQMLSTIISNKPPLPLKLSNHQQRHPQSIMKKKINNTMTGCSTSSTSSHDDKALITPRRMSISIISSEQRRRHLQFAPSSAAEFDKLEPVLYRNLTPLPPDVAAERFPTNILESRTQQEIEVSEETKRNNAILAQFDDDSDDSDHDDSDNDSKNSKKKKKRSKRSSRRSSSSSNKKKGKNRRESNYFSPIPKEYNPSDDDDTTTTLDYRIDDNQNCDDDNTDSIQFFLDTRLLMNDEDADVADTDAAHLLYVQTECNDGLEALDGISSLTLYSPMSVSPSYGNNDNMKQDHIVVDNVNKPICDELVMNETGMLHNEYIDDDDSPRHVYARSRFDDWLIFEKLPNHVISQETDGDEFVDILTFLLSQCHFSSMLRCGMKNLEDQVPAELSFDDESTQLLFTEDSYLYYDDWQNHMEHEWLRISNAMLDELIQVMDSEILCALDQSTQELDHFLEQIDSFDFIFKSKFVKKLYRKERILLSRTETEYEYEEKRNIELWQNLNNEIQNEVSYLNYLYKATLRLVPMELSEDLANMETIGLLYRPIIPGILVQLNCDIDGNIMKVDIISDNEENDTDDQSVSSFNDHCQIIIIKCFQELLSFGRKSFVHLLKDTESNDTIIYPLPTLLYVSSFLDHLNNTIWDLKQRIVDVCTIETSISTNELTLSIKTLNNVTIQALFCQNVTHLKFLNSLPCSIRALNNQNQIIICNEEEDEWLSNETCKRFQTIIYNMTHPQIDETLTNI